MAVYDDEKTRKENSLVPGDEELRHMTGVGADEEQAMEREARNGAAADIARREGKPLADEKNDEQQASLTPEELANKEKTNSEEEGESSENTVTDSDKVGEGYNDEDEENQSAVTQLVTTSKGRRKLLIGGGAGGAVVGGIVAVFLISIPLKIEHIVKNLEGHFFASSSQAVQNETNTLLHNYIEKYVAPGYKGCGTTRDRHCSPSAIIGTSPVANLYKTWKQARLENTLAEKYGIEIRYNSVSKTYFLKTPSLSGDGEAISPGKDAAISDSLLTSVDRGEVRQTIRDAVQSETKLTQIMYRFKVRGLLREKYAIPPCVIFCGAKDSINKFATTGKNTVGLFITQRVIGPQSKTLGIVLECLLTSCDATAAKPTTPQVGSTGELNGAPVSATDTAIRDAITLLAEKYGITDAETIASMVTAYTNITDKGFQVFLTEEILAAVGLTALSEKASTAVPILGWINQAAVIVKAITNAGPTLRKISYVTMAGSAVSLYMLYRTYVDEMHTGNVDAAQFGQFVDSLGPGNTGQPNDPLIGGTASAEQTPLYSNLMYGTSGSNTTTASLLSSLLPTKALAATTATTSPPYTCKGGAALSGLVCPEEKFGAGNDIINTIDNGINTPPFSLIVKIADIWNSTVGILFRLVGDLFSLILHAIPGVDQALGTITGFVQKLATPFTNFITDHLIPNPFGTNMSGGRKFDMMAAGADVSGNDYAHTGLGGQLLTSQQVASIQAEQQQQDKLTFEHQPFFARLFSTTEQHSLVSQLAMAVPIGDSSTVARSSIAGLLSNPLGKVLGGFGSLLTNNVTAQATPASDPFNVPQYGYTNTDPVFTTDPETYWVANHCDDAVNGLTPHWNQDAANNLDHNSYLPTNTTTDGCLLIQASAGSAGGYFSTSNLTPDDLGQTTTTALTPTNGSLLWPFATKANSQYNRVDQGWDIQTTAGGPIYAVAAGTIGKSTPDPGGFGNDYPYQQLDSPVQLDNPARSYGWIYYGHVHVLPSVIGQHVTAGQLIACANTVAGQNQSAAPPGWLEIGFALPGTGAPVQKGGFDITSTQAGLDMKNVLITAQPSPGAGSTCN